MYEVEKKELVQWCKALYERQLVTACDGNVSWMVDEEVLLITPSGRNKGFLKADEMMVVKLDGTVLEGKGKPSKEFPLHTKVYDKRKEVKAVIHTHPVYATAFAMAGINIPDNYLIESKVILGRCALAEYAPPGTVELAEKMEPFIEDSSAILLKNHGAVTYGDSMMDAFNKMEVLESIAKTIIMSKIIGDPVLIP